MREAVSAFAPTRIFVSDPFGEVETMSLKLVAENELMKKAE